MERICVYTCLFGQYEHLNDQPTANISSIPHICFTDDATLQSETWQIRYVTPRLVMDPLRSHRVVKIKPWDYLPEYDLSLYIDNSVILKKPADQIFKQYKFCDEIGIAQHSFREKVLDEFIEVARLGFDDQTRIFEQLNHYLVAHPNILDEKPYWGGMLIRDHRNEAIKAMADIWLTHVFRYSRRDQLSLNLAIKQSHAKLKLLNIDNFSSDFHDWPISHKRDRDRGPLNTALTLTMPATVQRQNETKNDLEIKHLKEEYTHLLNLQKNVHAIKAIAFALFITTILLLLTLAKKYYF